MTKTNWQITFEAQGAIYDEGAIQHYGDAVQELKNTKSSNILCDLSHTGLAALTGDDAVAFLQGQVTNDVKALNGHNAHLSGYCSPKGRLLALFLAFSYNHSLYLQFPRPLLPPIMKRLQMYIMRAKVNLTDVSDNMNRFGINGPDASAILSKEFSEIPNEDYAITSIQQDGASVGLIIKLPSIQGHQRFEIIIDQNHVHRILSTLKANCELAGKPCWDWLDIQTGLPEVVEKTQEQFVPQMLNLDLLNGINFKKGCYTGQEIVARTHYLGTVKRRTYKVSITTDVQPSAGDKIMDEQQNEVGQIVKTAPNLNNGFDALIEIRTEAKEAGTVYWDKHPVTFDTLPYSLEVKERSSH